MGHGKVEVATGRNNNRRQKSTVGGRMVLKRKSGKI